MEHNFRPYWLLAVMLVVCSCHSHHNNRCTNTKEPEDYTGVVLKSVVQLYADDEFTDKPFGNIFFVLELSNNSDDTLNMDFQDGDSGYGLSYIGDTADFAKYVRQWRNGEFVLGLCFPNEIDSQIVWSTGKLPIVQLTVVSPQEEVIKLPPHSSCKIVAKPIYILIEKSLETAVETYDLFLNGDFTIVATKTVGNKNITFTKANNYQVELKLDDEIVRSDDQIKMRTLTNFGTMCKQMDSLISSTFVR